MSSAYIEQIARTRGADGSMFVSIEPMLALACTVVTPPPRNSAPSSSSMLSVLPKSAINAPAFKEAGGEQARLVFYDNTGPFGTAHLLDEGDAKLVQLGLTKPFQNDVRALLLRQ